jgi:hypothetical protein
MAKVKKPTPVVPGIWEFDQVRVFEETLPNGVEIRLTVGWLSGYRDALYQMSRGEAMRHAEEKYGVSSGELLRDNAFGTPLFTEVQSWFERAYMFAALRKVEVKQGDDWVETEMPESWHDMDNFKFAIPGTLLEKWLNAAIDTNPQIFSVKQSEPEKKDEPLPETM